VDIVSWVASGRVDRGLFGLIQLVVALAVQITLVVFLGRGANWARVLLTIFAAAAAVFAVQYLLTLVGWLPEASSLVELAIEVVAVVLLYRGPANAYFRPGAVTTRSN
jgi:hypothetical protein